MASINFTVLDPRATVPVRPPNTVAYDLFALEDVSPDLDRGMASLRNLENTVLVVRTGVSAQFVESSGGLIRDTQSMILNKGLYVVGGVIHQANETNELIVYLRYSIPAHPAMMRFMSRNIAIQAGEKVAQIIPL